MANWDLSALYDGFEGTYTSDLEQLDLLMKEYVTFIATPTDPVKYLEGYLIRSEKIGILSRKLGAFASLTQATDVTHTIAQAKLATLSRILRQSTAEDVQFTRYLASINLDDIVKKSALVSQYRFLLELRQQEAHHLLSEKEEVLYSKMREFASGSWGQLQSMLTANLNVTYRGNDLSFSTVRNLAYDKDPSVRKDAFEAEIKALRQVEDTVAMALSNIKREVNTITELRGYPSALAKTLEQSRMSEKTLEAMIDAMKEFRPIFAEYLKAKSAHLGYQKSLPFYDLFAPVGKLDKSYTYHEAQALVVEGFQSFSPKLASFAKTAFDQNWVDPFPKKGKRGGAFCSNLPFMKQSRILSNFDGSLSDVLTLAHELGHGYHGDVISANPPLLWSYPMPLAETASIFCETIMNQHLLKSINSPSERLSVLENSLQGDTQVIIDILSRFFFEKELFEQAQGPVSKTKMNEMMIKAQKDAYTDGLDHEQLHPYMWLVKGHYYSAGLNYYNFPYAFGLLFGKGLYAQYKKNPTKFVKEYDALLAMTTQTTVEKAALTMGIDVTSPLFWKESLTIIASDIAEVITLLKL